jgi:hypothetical protein
MTTPSLRASSFKQVVCGVYAAGARLFVDTYGGLLIDGEIPPDLKKQVRAHKADLLKMLTGDPLQGPGWEGRTALYKQALKYLDRIVERKGLDQDAAVEVLCRIYVAEKLNEGWNSPNFEDFRTALKEYIQVGLDAARGKKPKMKLKAS